MAYHACLLCKTMCPSVVFIIICRDPNLKVTTYFELEKELRERPNFQYVVHKFSLFLRAVLQLAIIIKIITIIEMYNMKNISELNKFRIYLSKG